MKTIILKRPLWLRVLLVALICAADILFAVKLIYDWKKAGVLISASNASSDIPGILFQNLLTIAIPILIFVVTLLILKKDFPDEMYLKINGKWQWGGVLVLLAVFTGAVVYFLISKGDRVSTLYCAFYYTFIISFTEEFVCRDACTWLLKNEKSEIRYVIPNLFFASMHIFNYSGWEAFTSTYVLKFLFHDLIILFAVGCFFQLLKEKTGTIWIPVLLHAIWDFSIP